MKNTFDLLKSTRKRRRVSAEALAQATDYTRASIYRYEKHAFKSIAFETLVKIAVNLSIHIDQLLTTLHADGYSDEDLDIITNLYKEEYEKVNGTIPHFKLDSEHADGIGEEVASVLHREAQTVLNVAFDRFKDDKISTPHIDLIEYCVKELDDDQAVKALKLLKVVFDD